MIRFLLGQPWAAFGRHAWHWRAVEESGRTLARSTNGYSDPGRHVQDIAALMGGNPAAGLLSHVIEMPHDVARAPLERVHQAILALQQEGRP